MARDTLARTLHDAGLAAWFGGSLMGAVGLNAAAGVVDDPRQAGRVANEGWDRWTPVNALAIGAHLAGAAMILATNSKRVAGQKGVGTTALVKTGLTVSALGVTAYSRMQGRKLSAVRDVPASAGATPHPQTPSDLAAAQSKLHALQYAVPAVTGALVVVSALAGEQQRPSEVSKGMAQRVTSLVSH